MKLQSSIAHIFAMAVAALMLASCGGGGEENNADSPGTAAVSPPPADPPPTDPPPTDPPPNPGNLAPSISGVPGNSIAVGGTYLFTPAASDPDGDTLIFSIQNLPAWASFDNATGSLSGVPDAGDVATYANISITVSDGMLSTSLSAFAISVNQVSLGSATLSWIAPTQNEDGSVLIDLTAYKFYISTSLGSYGNPILVSNPGITSYVVENLSPNTYFFIMTAINSSGIESSFSNAATKTVL